ncbi:LysR family transcriptional regulator [Caulobacter sp. KR2-114]|uniref:LysR family transcriptional regulator n=1 Tax=Caulobacter sp. KR2-114 TaxID=3400912 RepID=UPI003BFF175B
MTLEQLRIFVAVAERQHVTRAAHALNLTQSAVSSAVTALEARHGVALFDRVGRSIVLNPAGAVFLDEARAVLARAAAAEAALADLGDLSRGRLSIHASQTIASYWLPARLAAFHKAYPGIALQVAIGNTSDVTRAVAEGDAELGLVEGEVDDPALERVVMDHDPLCLVVGRDHPWAGLTAEPKDLAASEWVVREAGSGTRAALEGALRTRGLALDGLPLAMVLPGNEAVRSAVRAGAGATLISRSVVTVGLELGSLVEVPFAVAPRAFWRLRHRQRYRSRAGEAFLQVAAGLQGPDRSAISNVFS